MTHTHTNVLHLFVSRCKHIPDAGALLCNKIVACHQDNRDAFRNFPEVTTTGVAQLTARLLSVKVFGSRLLKVSGCIMQMN